MKISPCAHISSAPLSEKTAFVRMLAEDFNLLLESLQNSESAIDFPERERFSSTRDSESVFGENPR